MKQLKQFKPILALILAITLLFSMPLGALAADGNAGMPAGKAEAIQKAKSLLQGLSAADRANLPRLSYEEAADQAQLIRERAERLSRDLNPEERRALLQLAEEVVAEEVAEATAGTNAEAAPVTLDAPRVKPVFVAPELELVADDEEVDVIIQFRQDPAEIAVLKAQLLGRSLSIEDAQRDAAAAHRQFKADLVRSGKRAKIVREFSNAFNGVAVQLPASQLDALTQSSTVKAVWPNLPVYLDPIEAVQADDVGIMMHDSIPHLGVDQLHQMGITGQGVKVAVIDTGIDYNHPDFTRPDGTSVYVGGYDFVDNDDDPMETTYEDWQGSGKPEFSERGNSYYTDHGTHVSGTVAGQGTYAGIDYAVKGIAPGVELYAYRVLGPYGSGTTANVIAAIDRSVAEGMDVINLSLGNSSNDPFYASSIALNNAMLLGTVAVTSAGNSGPGDYTVGSPGTSALAISVGATNVPLDSAEVVATAAGENYDMPLLGYNTQQGIAGMVAVLENQAFPIVYVNLGTTQDFEGLDVTGKMVLIKRGSIPFVEKMANAKAAGAKAAIIFNSVDGPLPFYFGDGFDFLPTFNMSKADGERLLAAIQAADVPVTGVPVLDVEKGAGGTGNKGTLNRNINIQDRLKNQSGIQTSNQEKQPKKNPLRQKQPIQQNQGLMFNFGQFQLIQTEGDLIADFSSRGPVSKLFDIKPDVAAPGVAVFSTIPAYINDPVNQSYETAYARFNGTSMASPHVAGVAALVLQAHPEYSTFDVKTALMNTAVPLAEDYNVFVAGAGRVDAYHAVMTDLLIQVEDETIHIVNGEQQVIEEITGSISFGKVDGDGNNYTDQRTIRFHNHGDADKTLTLAVEYLSPTLPNVADAITNGVTLDVPAQVTVAAGSDLAIEARLTIPGQVDEGIYQGYINITEGDSAYRIPFAVFYGFTGMAGIDYVTMDPISFSPNNDNYLDYTDIYFGYHNQMEYTEILLWSGETGEYVGLIGYINQPIPAGNYRISGGWDGYYFPIDADGNIGSEPVLADDGYFTIDFYAYDATGREFVKWGDVFTDTTKPLVELATDPGTYEIPADQPFTLSGNVNDTNLQMYRSAGYNVTQALNIAFILDLANFDILDLAVDDEGNFSYTFTVAEGETVALLLGVEDFAGNMVDSYYELTGVAGGGGEEPNPGITIQLPQEDGEEKREYRLGETIRFDVTAQDLENLFTSQYTLAYDPAMLELVSMDAHPTVRQYAAENGLSLQYFSRNETGHPATHPNHQLTTGIFTLLGQGAAITGDMPLYQVEMRVTEDKARIGATDLFIHQASYVNNQAGMVELLAHGAASEEAGNFKTLTILPTTSMITGQVLPEGLAGADLRDKTIHVKAISETTGEEFVGTITDADGHFAIEVENDARYGLSITVAGHFVVYPDAAEAQVEVGQEDVNAGRFHLTAGDVDQNDRIDLIDLFYVAFFYDLDQGNKDRATLIEERMAQLNKTLGEVMPNSYLRQISAKLSNMDREDVDINQDGTVNIIDLGFVILNFNQSNPYSTETNQAGIALPAGLELHQFLEEFLPEDVVEQLDLN